MAKTVKFNQDRGASTKVIESLRSNEKIIAKELNKAIEDKKVIESEVKNSSASLNQMNNVDASQKNVNINSTQINSAITPRNESLEIDLGAY